MKYRPKLLIPPFNIRLKLLNILFVIKLYAQMNIWKIVKKYEKE